MIKRNRIRPESVESDAPIFSSMYLDRGKLRKLESTRKYSKAGFNLVWSFACLFYAFLLINIGILFPLLQGFDIMRNDTSMQLYTGFYWYLYAVSLLCVCFKYGITSHICVMIRSIGSSISGFFTHLARSTRNLVLCCIKRDQRYFFQSNSSSTTETASAYSREESTTFVAPARREHKAIGRLGLQVGIKVTAVIVIMLTLLDLSAFLHLKTMGEICDSDLKGSTLFLQLLFFFSLTHFCLNNHRVMLHKYPRMAHFCMAHLLASTVCTGFLFISYDRVYKVQRMYQTSEEHPEKYNVSQEFLKTLPLFKNNLGIRNGTACHLKTYIRSISAHIGSYTFIFAMFHVYISTIILTSLFLHYQGSSMTPGNPHEEKWTVFRRLKSRNKVQASLSGAASLSLVIGAFVVSILSLGGEDNNIFIHIYLLILHTQAVLVCFVTLKRIFVYPLDSRRETRGDSIILLIFFLGVVLYNCIKHLGATFQEEEVSKVEVATTAVEITQTIQQTVLILVGLKISLKSTDQTKDFPAPPTELIIHLIAGNISSMITSVVLTRMELFSVDKFLEKPIEALSFGMAWSTMGSILLPWQAFYRYYSIVCLAELKKIAAAD